MPAPRKPLRGKGSAKLGTKSSVRTAGGQGLQYTSGGESSAKGLTAAQKKWIRENVLGVRQRKPGQPEIIEAGVSGARKAAMKALLAGEPQLIETTKRSVAKQAEALYESEKRWRSMLKKLDPADRAKAEQLLRRFGPESGYYKPMERTEVLRQVEQAAARRSGKQPVKKAARPYRKPAVEYRSKAAEDLAAKRAASAKRAQQAREKAREEWKKMYSEQLARIVVSRPSNSSKGIDVIGNLERGAQRRKLLQNPKLLAREATDAQKAAARKATDAQWKAQQQTDLSAAKFRARQDYSIGVTKKGVRSVEKIPGLSRRDAGMKEIPVKRPPRAVIDPSRTDAGGDVTWRMVAQRAREAEKAARRAARKRRIQAVKAKKTPTQ